jgi:hypothetical protein
VCSHIRRINSATQMYLGLPIVWEAGELHHELNEFYRTLYDRVCVNHLIDKTVDSGILS